MMAKVLRRVGLFSFVVFLSSASYSQGSNTKAIEITEISDKSVIQNSEHEIEKIYSIRNLDAQSLDSSVSIQFLGETKDFALINENNDLANYHYWYGKSPEGDELRIIFAEGYFRGSSRIDNIEYQFTGMSNQFYMTKLKLVDNSFQCGTVNENNQYLLPQFDNKSSVIDDKNYNSLGNTSFDCAIRLLVVYTPTAAVQNQFWLSNGFGPQYMAVTIVNDMNSSFINSNVNAEVELAYSGIIDYDDSHGNIFLHIENFRNSGNNDPDPNNPEMDLVHNLRQVHQADYCLLIADVDAAVSENTAGIAYKIKAQPDNGFAVIQSSNFLSGIKIAIHEIGHLIGCQHHPQQVVNGTYSSIYPYAHGYYDIDNNFYTLMPSPLASHPNMPRYLNWSNPSVNIANAPSGVVNQFNNARLIDEKHTNSMALLQPVDHLQIAQNQMDDAKIADVIAKQSISSYSSITIDPDQIYKWRTYDQIGLNDGFEVKEGAEFEAYAGIHILDCGFSDGDNGDYGNNKIAQTSEARSNLIPDKLTIFPNPVSSEDFLYIALKNFSSLNSSLNDINGKKLFEINKSCENEFPCERLVSLSLNNGVYVFSGTIDGEVFSRKIVVQ